MIFTGYSIEKHRDFDVLIAEPEKALIDYLYFRTRRNKEFNFEEERFDIDVIQSLSKKKLKRYAKLFNFNLEVLYAHL